MRREAPLVMGSIAESSIPPGTPDDGSQRDELMVDDASRDLLRFGDGRFALARARKVPNETRLHVADVAKLAEMAKGYLEGGGFEDAAGACA